MVGGEGGSHAWGVEWEAGVITGKVGDILSGFSIPDGKLKGGDLT